MKSGTVLSVGASVPLEFGLCHLPVAHWTHYLGCLWSFSYISQFSRSVMSDSLWPHGLQYSRLPCPSPIPGTCSNLCSSSWWCHPTLTSSVPPSPPAFNLSQHQSLFQWVSSSHQVAKVLELLLNRHNWSSYWPLTVINNLIPSFSPLSGGHWVKLKIPILWLCGWN